MDRDDTRMSDRSDEARQGDTGMIGSESEDPGPGRDTSLTDPDPVAASTDQPRGTVAMSEGDPMRTRLGSHVEGAGAIGYDVAASEEGATQETPADDRPGYEPERSAADPSGVTPATTAPTAVDRDPGLAAEPVVDREAYERDAGLAPAGDQTSFERDPVVNQGEYARDAGLTGDPVADRGEFARDAGYVEDDPVIDRGRGERVDDVGPSDRSLFADEPPTADPDRSVFATEDTGAADRSTIADDRVYDQEADQARRPSDGV